MWGGYWPSRSVQQFFTEELDLSEIEWVDSGEENTDWDVIVEYGWMRGRPPNDKRPSLLFVNEPTWDGVHTRHIGKDITWPLVYWTLDPSLYNIENLPLVKAIPQFCKMYYGGLTACTGDGPWRYETIRSTDFQKYKTNDICSFVSTRNPEMPGHMAADGKYPSSCLYARRCNLITALLPNLQDSVDFYGGWKTERTENSYQSKWDNLQRYKFSLAIENSNEKYYVSEKFHDCILQETVPIYFGCSNIADLYGEEYGYIAIHDIDNHDAVRKQLLYIKQNASEIYAQKLPQLLDVRRKYFSEMNPLKQVLDTLKTMGYITNYLSGKDNAI
jgi:hypothetical protein